MQVFVPWQFHHRALRRQRDVGLGGAPGRSPSPRLRASAWTMSPAAARLAVTRCTVSGSQPADSGWPGLHLRPLMSHHHADLAGRLNVSVITDVRQVLGYALSDNA